MTEITAILIGYCLGMLSLIALDRIREDRELAYYENFDWEAFSQGFKKECEKFLYNQKESDD